jgi:hypothetical protein
MSPPGLVMVSPRSACSQRAPLRYCIDQSAGVVFIDLFEIKNTEAVMVVLRAVQDDPAFHTALDVCVDCGYLSAQPAIEDAQAVARACLAEVGTSPVFTGRCAIIARSAHLATAVSCFAEIAISRRDRLAVFPTLRDAMRWLQRADPDVMQRRETYATPEGARALHEIVRRSGLARS